MKQIIIYALPGCSFCRQAKEYFEANNVLFEEINVEENEQAAEDIIERTGQSGFPVLDIQGELIIGFDREKIEEVLKNADK